MAEEIEEPEETKEINLDQLGLLISKANELCDLIKEVDPISERQSRVLSIIENAMKCYKLEQQQQTAKKRKQTDIGNFFNKKSKQ